MNKALFITKHNPLSNSGGGLATRCYMEIISIIFKGNIDLCIADSCDTEAFESSFNTIYKIKKRSKFKKVLSIFSGEMHRYTSFVKQLLNNNPNEYSHCFFDHNCIAGTLVNYVNKLGIKTITINHNYEPEYFWDNRTNFLKDFIFLYHVKSNQKKAYKNSSLNLFLTQSDLDKFVNEYKNCRGINYLIGCYEHKEITRNIIQYTEKDELTFVLSGSMCSVQTIDAIKYFFSNLYKYIPLHSKIIISGRNPTNEIINLCNSHKNVTLIANPPNINEIISNADIYICTTRIGGGLKLRVMDGLRNGLPIITHKISSRGFDPFFSYNFFSIFNNENDFLEAINQQINNINNGIIDKKEIQEVYYKNFSLQAGVDKMRNVLRI